jgi:hypothetical protein
MRAMTKTRVPVAFHDRPPPIFEPTEGQWQEIGGDYCALDDADRLAIKGIVNDYFARHHYESTGTYADAIAYCRKVQKAADALDIVLRGSPGLNATAAAQSVADREIEARIKSLRPFDLCRFKDDLGLLAGFARVFAATLRKQGPADSSRRINGG